MYSQTRDRPNLFNITEVRYNLVILYRKWLFGTEFFVRYVYRVFVITECSLQRSFTTYPFFATELGH